MSSKKSYRKQKKQLNKFAQFSGLAFQMVIIISLGTFLGYKIDMHFEITKSVFTIILSLLSIGSSLLYVIYKSKEI
ncbi:MAG: AtpZ/AtpI family protein [Flavobacteriales bacterium]